MNKRVYGVLGIKSIMANWNADFTGYPKTTSTGDIFGSDKALKYPMKKMWDSQGKKVLYIKSYKQEEDKKKKDEIKIVPRSLKERYEAIFEVEDLEKETDNKKVLSTLFTAADVKQFGATFAEAKKNFSIIGAVQIGQGFNKYVDSDIQVQPILSPFRDATKEGAEASTLGTKIVSDEAHYFYPFVINPMAYKEYISMGFTDGYTENDYKEFKEASLVGATAFNSNSKLGCENEFALFIEVEEELYLPDLAQYIRFEKTEGKDVIIFEFDSLIQAVKDRVKQIEVYYNPLKTKIQNKLEGAKYYHIFTREEIRL